MDFMEKASSKKRLIDANALIKEANVTHWMPLPEPPKGE